MDSAAIKGGCLCGAVRYQLDRPPESSMLCHCRTCRRQAGAPVMAWLSVAAAGFRFLQGAPARLASSPGITREFCAQCGTSLTWRAADDQEWLDVTTCSLDDPDAYPPTHHAWMSHDLGWLKFDDGLPAYPRSRHDESG
jgi:hypothetical protein